MKIEQRSEGNMNVNDDVEMLLSELPGITSSFIREILNDDHQDHDNLVHHGYDHGSFETRNMNGYGWGHRRVDGMYDHDECLMHRYGYASAPLGQLSLQSNGSSHLVSGGGRSYLDIGSQSRLISGNGYLVDSSNSSMDFSRMYISDGIQYSEQSLNGANGTSFGKYGAYDYHRNGFKDCTGFSLCHSRMANMSGSQQSPHQSRFGNSPLGPRFRGDNVIVNNNFQLTPQYNEVNLLQAFTRGQGINYGMTRHANMNMYRSQPGRESSQSPRMSSPHLVTPKCSSLPEAQGCIQEMAKDHHGCRFLQKLFDDGAPYVQIIFNGIIDNVVDLMTDRFGNYLMQKLLEVCNEEQRMHILVKATKDAGELVRISRNTYGTRVVQKLIETVKTSQQISLVVSALQQGFPTLVKDLNGNHVIQRCLEFFTNEDTQSLFVSAAKNCVDIGTHEHGCRVLLHFIDYSTGELQAKLVTTISENGLLLAQDSFGNYVVQRILELKIPCATSKLTSQFEGNYVNLSTQKFSSHVVEKCLNECNEEVRSKIIKELLSTTYFDQLLQHPHANYVIQKALEFSKGHLHNSLVNAIESCKAISRYSPFSKNIFSNKHLKK